jgi:hypothetical protein
MPRRPTDTKCGVPLRLIPQLVLRWIQIVGEELDWIRVRRSAHNLYTVSVRTRPVDRAYGMARLASGAV